MAEVCLTALQGSSRRIVEMLMTAIFFILTHASEFALLAFSMG